MDRFGADGDVIDISLSTIKVQNWDKTISMIPTYMFTADSFKNWRGMEESGGRRVKRAINLKIASVRFCDREMVNRFSKIQMLSDYLKEKDRDIEMYNQESNADKSYPINGRHLTNLGVFREYATRYLRNNEHCNQNMTMMVRQLAPGVEGIPVEMYFFTSTTNWVEYEGIQADVFDHLLASVGLFDLEVFEKPTGTDFQKLVN